MAIAALAPAAPMRPAGDLTDHELVAAVRAGDDRAFELLYTRYHRRIAAYVHGMVRDHARAEDIAQDVFMSALRRMRETERPIAFKPWVYEIAKNACIDQFRRSRRAEEVSYDSDAGLPAADQGRLTARGPSPEAAVEHKQQLDHLRGAFGGLSDAHHEILVMREFEGLSYREIGERLGMTRPSVESTLFRARRRLSEEYDDLATGQRCLRVQALVLDAAGGSLGSRDRRRLGRHISHCTPCRRHARLAGLDTEVLTERLVRERLAALLPLPAFMRRRGGTDDGVSSFGLSAHPVAQWTATAAHYADSGFGGWAKAAAAAATIAVAGSGVNAAVHDHGLHLDGRIADRVLAAPSGSGTTRAPGDPSAAPVAMPGPPAASAPRSAIAAPTPVRRDQVGSSGGASSPQAPAAAVPGAGTVDGEALRGLLDPASEANATPRPSSGSSRPLADVAPLIPKSGAPELGPVSVPVQVPDPSAVTDAVKDGVAGTAGDGTDGAAGVGGAAGAPGEALGDVERVIGG